MEALQREGIGFKRKQSVLLFFCLFPKLLLTKRVEIFTIERY